MEDDELLKAYRKMNEKFEEVHEI